MDFLQTSKTILMNYLCLDPHVGSKPRLKPRGNTDSTSRVYIPRFQFLSPQSMVTGSANISCLLQLLYAVRSGKKRLLKLQDDTLVRDYGNKSNFLTHFV